MTSRPAEILRLPVGQAFGRRAGGRHPLRSGRALCARSGLPAFPLPQYALRRGPARGPGQDDAGCRARRSRIGSLQSCLFDLRRLEARMVGFSYGGALALALGYLSRLNSLSGSFSTRLSGAGDLRAIGSGQYRRDQRPAHRTQGARRRDACARRPEGDAGRRSGLVGVRARRRRSRRRPARSSATCIRSGLGFAAARASPLFSAVSSASRGRRRSYSPSSGSRSPALTRYSSAAALAATVASPIAMAAIGEGGAALVFAALAALIWFKHSANIGRLLNGSELEDRAEKLGDGEQA